MLLQPQHCLQNRRVFVLIRLLIFRWLCWGAASSGRQCQLLSPHCQSPQPPEQSTGNAICPQSPGLNPWCCAKHQFLHFTSFILPELHLGVFTRCVPVALGIQSTWGILSTPRHRGSAPDLLSGISLLNHQPTTDGKPQRYRIVFKLQRLTLKALHDPTLIISLHRFLQFLYSSISFSLLESTQLYYKTDTRNLILFCL